MRKLYACNKYRHLRIKHLQFQNGLLRVDNLGDQVLVETNDLYGAHIFPVPEREEETQHGQAQTETGKTDKGISPPAKRTQAGSRGKAGKTRGNSRRKKSPVHKSQAAQG